LRREIGHPHFHEKIMAFLKIALGQPDAHWQDCSALDRATLTQSEEGAWRFSCSACLIDGGAALERATMAAKTLSLNTSILRE
jgi:hypothetical protein